MKTKFCLYCKTVKNETPENFQRRGDTFRSPCKACMKKIKNRKKPDIVEKMFNEVMPNVKFTDMKLSKSESLEIQTEAAQEEKNKVKIEMEEDSDIFAKIYQKHNRFFTIQYSPNKLVLTFHGSPTTVVKGTVDEVLSEVLGD